MGPTGLAKAPQQHFIGRIKKQHLHVMARGPHVAQHLRQGLQELAAAQIDAERDAPDFFLVALAKSMNLGINSAGRLSTQKKPLSSRARIAKLFPNRKGR